MTSDLKLALSQVIGYSPSVRILDILIRNKGHNHTMVEVVRGANVTYPVVRHVLGILNKYDFVVEAGKPEGRKRYRLNGDNPGVKHLLALHSHIVKVLSQEKSSSVEKTEARPDPDSCRNIT